MRYSANPCEQSSFHTQVTPNCRTAQSRFHHLGDARSGSLALSTGSELTPKSLSFFVPMALRKGGQVLRRIPAFKADVKPPAPKPPLVISLPRVELIAVARTGRAHESLYRR